MEQGLQHILYRAGIVATEGRLDRRVTDLVLDSRRVAQDCLFAALPGTHSDGHAHIPSAIALGATAILCERMPEERVEGVAYIQVKDVRKALGAVAANFFGNPSTSLRLVGITGTNGKTTAATLLYQVFRKLGYPSGLLSTISNRIDDKEVVATHTTPDVISVNRMLAAMAEARCAYAFMEVSSHAVDQERIAGLQFAGGIFSNLTHDHLDYHLTFEAYRDAKKAFFDQLPKEAFALSNADDRNGLVMLQNTSARRTTYSLLKPADYKGLILESDFSGMQLKLNGSEMWTSLVGRFNAYNILAVYGAATELGVSAEELLPALSSVVPAEGRFEYVRDDAGRTAIVDYAHTPDALKNVLETINEIRAGQGMLITVVGAGGDRDAAKRPLMAALAARMSDKVILTSDNPRSEDPELIIREMQGGLDPLTRRWVLSITDRKEAIRAACSLASRGDIILVAGKGHEKYQEIKGIRYPFDDKAVVAEALKETTQG